MRKNTFIVAILASAAALGAAWWTAPDAGLVDARPVATVVPSSSAVETARTPSPSQPATVPPGTLRKLPGPDRLVQMPAFALNPPEALLPPESESELPPGLDWDTVAWSESDGVETPVDDTVDAAWFGL